LWGHREFKGNWSVVAFSGRVAILALLLAPGYHELAWRSFAVDRFVSGADG
jgi:hypothetical protein